MGTVTCLKTFERDNTNAIRKQIIDGQEDLLKRIYTVLPANDEERTTRI